MMPVVSGRGKIHNCGRLPRATGAASPLFGRDNLVRFSVIFSDMSFMAETFSGRGSGVVRGR